MNAVITSTGSEYLTFAQRDVLRAARMSGQLRDHRAGGVVALDAKGNHSSLRYPRRTLNALQRAGFVSRVEGGWELTSAGRAAAGEA